MRSSPWSARLTLLTTSKRAIRLGGSYSSPWPLRGARELFVGMCIVALRGLIRRARGSAETQISQGGKIFLGPIRRNCTYIESVAPEVVAACARPAAQ